MSSSCSTACRTGVLMQSLYAHLKTVSDIPLGALMGRGEQIGTVGTAHGNYLAHLHFEMMNHRP